MTCRKCKSFIAASKSLERYFDELNNALDLKLPRPRLIKERITDSGIIWCDAYFNVYESLLRPTIVYSPAIVIHNGFKKPFMIRSLMLHEMIHYEDCFKDSNYLFKKKRVMHTQKFKQRLNLLIARFRKAKPRLKIIKFN